MVHLSRKRPRKNPPTKSTSHNGGRKSRKRVKRPDVPPSLALFAVTREEWPDRRGHRGRFAPSETAIINAAMYVAGKQTDDGGCFVLANRDISKGEEFTCTRVLLFLRRKCDGPPNEWAVQASHQTSLAVCRSLGWSLGKGPHGGPTNVVWTGPSRDGKVQSNGYLYTHETPPDDRTAEVLFRLNSSKCDGVTNAILSVNTVRKDNNMENMAIAQLKVTATKTIKMGCEIRANYDFI